MLSNQPLATKRKRDQTILEYEHNKRLSSKVVSSIATFPSNDTAKGKLFTSGDFCIIQDAAIFYRSLTSKVLTSYIVEKPQNGDFEEAMDVGSGPNGSLDIIAASRTGRIVLANVPKDGSEVIFAIHNIAKEIEDEIFTTVCHAGNAIVLGTSHENIYLIRRYGRSLTADRLRRSQGFLSGLIKFMGIFPSAATGDENGSTIARGVLKLMPVPMSFQLIGLTYRNVMLWSEWSSPGNESLLWEFNVKESILDDVNSVLGLSANDLDSIIVLDGCLMQPDAGAECAVLLTLSVYRTQQLWLHTWELSLLDSEALEGKPMMLLHRLRIADNICYDKFGDNTINLAPKIHNTAPSWRVLVTWGARADGDSATLRMLHFDILNQAPLGAGSDSLSAGLCCADQVDSEIPTSNIISTAAVVGLDGVCAVLKDGTVVSIRAPLMDEIRQGTTTGDALLSNSTAQSRMQASIRRSTQSTDAEALLLAFAWEECVEYDVRDHLRNAFAAIGSMHLVNIVKGASSKICNGSRRERSGASDLVGHSNDSSRYQSVRQLTSAKLEAHRRFIEVLKASNGFVVQEVQRVVYFDHQQLLLSAGLAKAIEEAKLKLSNQTIESSGDKNQIGGEEALRIISYGIEASVRRSSGINTDLDGASVTEAFFTQTDAICDGVEIITRTLCDGSADWAKELQRSVATRGVTFDTAYNLSSIILSGLQFTLQLPIATNVKESVVEDFESGGANDPDASISCRLQIRRAIKMLLQLLRENALNATEFQEKSKADQKQQFNRGQSLLTDTVAKGRRMLDLCRVLLQGYALEASKSFNAENTFDEMRHGEHMPSAWKEDFESAKEKCTTLLLAMRQSHGTFALCGEYLYHAGLMLATDQDPQLLKPQLLEILRSHGKRPCTGSGALLMRCLQWLADLNRPSELIELGKQTNRKILEEFLENYPQWSWIYQIERGQYSAATTAVTKHVRNLQHASSVNTLLSIAKLSAKCASDLSLSDKNLKSENMSEPVLLEMNANLAAIRSQRLISDIFPIAFPDTEERILPSDLIDLVTRALFSHGEVSLQSCKGTSATDENRTAADPMLSPSSTSDLVRAFGVALGLLTMQMDALEQSINREESPASSSKHRYAGQGQMIAEMVKRLWAGLISADSVIWLEVATQSSLGLREEALLRDNSWFYQVMRDYVLPDVFERNIRPSLVPSLAIKDLSQSDELLLYNTENSLLHDALMLSGIADKLLTEDGALSTVPVSNQPAHITKLSNAINFSISVALEDVTAANE